MDGVDCYRVKTDEAASFMKGLNYLISLGHKKIALLGGVNGITSTDIKLNTFKQNIDSLQIETKLEWIIESGYSIEEALWIFRNYL